MNKGISWSELKDLPEMPKAMPLLWATDGGIEHARMLSWACSNRDWEEHWPDHERQKVHEARAFLLAMNFIAD